MILIRLLYTPICEFKNIAILEIMKYQFVNIGSLFLSDSDPHHINCSSSKEICFCSEFNLLQVLLTIMYCIQQF
jgi:hypothetical protein